MYKIGIDVGGTNTDATLDHQLNLIRSVKVPTTDNIQTGIAGALNKVWQNQQWTQPKSHMQYLARPNVQMPLLSEKN